MKHLNLQQHISLESIDESIALEAGMFSNLKHILLDSIPNLIHGAKKLFTFSHEKYDLTYMEHSYSVIERYLIRANFALINDLELIGPEGMTSKLPVLLDVLIGNMEYSNKSLKILNEFKSYLSTLINNPEARKNLKDNSNQYKNIDRERNIEADKLKGCYTKVNSVKAAFRLDELVSNNTEWLECYKKLEKLLALGKVYDITTYNKTVNECTELLTALEGILKSTDHKAYSPETTKTLSAITLTVAREVEFHFLTVYRITEVKRVYEKSTDMLIKALRGA